MPTDLLFLTILGAMTIAGAAAAMTLRSMVHSILALTVAFVGLALIFLTLNAQFVGFTQVLVYVGAVAILAVFAIMMTRSALPTAAPIASKGWVTGLLTATSVFAVLAWAILRANPAATATTAPDTTVRNIGLNLMQSYTLPLEALGLLLTAALIGAILVAMPLGKPTGNPSAGGQQ